MSVVNGQPANATVFNGAFVSRTTDTSTVGVLTLNNTSNPFSGAQIVNTQRYINEIALSLGLVSEGDPNANLYSSNFIIQDGDSRKQALERLDDAFNPLTGHNHDGVNSRPISAAVLENLNYYRADWVSMDILGASGTTFDVSVPFTGFTAGGNTNTVGVVTDPPLNRCEIRYKTTETYVEDAEGQRVYARLTESAGAWTLSFYTNEAGVETAHNLALQDLILAFKQVFTLETIPTFGADAGVLGSFDVSTDIVFATETIAGKVYLADQAAEPIADTGAKGTSTAVAREDHVHEGVHEISIFGDPGAPLLGDVELEAGTGILLSYSSGRILIESNAAGDPQVEYRTISAGEALSKSLTLLATPLTAAKTVVDAIGGGAQEYGVDYSVSGAVLSWSGLGLDTLGLAAGDKLRIIYWS